VNCFLGIWTFHKHQKKKSTPKRKVQEEVLRRRESFTNDPVILLSIWPPSAAKLNSVGVSVARFGQGWPSLVSVSLWAGEIKDRLLPFVF
jgi:hypothetical protein